MRCGVVLGQGRSGTNWMVDTLDLSPHTFCRNEPNEASRAAMYELPNPWLIGTDAELLDARWDAVAAHTATHMGERDHRISQPKTYVHGWSQRLGIAQASARPRIRRAAKLIIRPWGRGEWPMPRWVGTGPGSVDGTVAVFKLVQTYNWAAWLVEHRPEVPIVHIVRHPCGRHDSFLRRYVADSDAEATRIGKVNQLAEIVASSEEWAERIGDPQRLDLAEAETWFGVYQMEMLERIADGKPSYRRVIYENMVTDPIPAARSVFDLFDLDLTDDIIDRINASVGESVFGAVSPDRREQAEGWRERLDAKTRSRIEAILATSPIAEWWPESDGAARSSAA